MKSHALNKPLSLWRSLQNAAIFCLLLLPLAASAKTYTFYYGGQQRSFTWDIPTAALQHYNSNPHNRNSFRDLDAYIPEDAGFEYLDNLADELVQAAANEGLYDWQMVNYIIALVQSLEYFNDPNPTADYVRYPIETLADQGGDCEDTALLLAVILDRLGYSTVIMDFPGHIGVGIACSDCEGTKLPWEGTNFYYIETTGEGFEIGQMGDNARFTTCEVVELPNTRSGFMVASNGEPSGIGPGQSLMAGVQPNRNVPLPQTYSNPDPQANNPPEEFTWPQVATVEPQPGEVQWQTSNPDVFAQFGQIQQSHQELLSQLAAQYPQLNLGNALSMQQSQMEHMRNIQQSQLQHIQQMQNRMSEIANLATQNGTVSTQGGVTTYTYSTPGTTIIYSTTGR